MFWAKVALPVALLFSIFSLDYIQSKELSGADLSQPTDCKSCGTCPYPCQNLPPPPPASLGGYPLYGVPPPPPKQQSGYTNCPPTAGGQTQCCPPPPNPYTYLPYNSYNYAPASCLPNLFFFIALLFPFTALF